MEKTKSNKALTVLKTDAKKIRQELFGQFDELCLMQCPIVEEIMDTQMLVFSREVDFAKRCDLISKETALMLINDLSLEIEAFYQEITKKQTQQKG
ncbi:DUF1507 family protein [Agrilactobacillus fermenti]|uniref:DUF1507 family protein n=1 Tax=Agrilactobacillus fermenti TaxID=2586909 RepID=UPI001E585E1E|nr:DUF1507 family protein [Agrilactobacillus fermenti]MCD2255268.1 DUF1507 family protein [Agrilactobacillus fermenti]